MRKWVTFIVTFLTIFYSCSQNAVNNKNVSQNALESCKCLDNIFSSSNNKPIAYSKIGKHPVAFCGLMGGVYEMDSVPLRSSTFGFKRTGYEIVLCSKDSAIFIEGEYYTDSIFISDDGFKLYTLSDFPTTNELEYRSIPLLEFHFRINNDHIKIDTSIAVPALLLEENYLNKLENLVETYKRDTTDLSKYHDLNLHYLFLRAVTNDSYKKDFIESGPYDGYMGPIFRDFKSYLELEKN